MTFLKPTCASEDLAKMAMPDQNMVKIWNEISNLLQHTNKDN